MITLGTGVGGSFIIDGKLYSGSNGLASEIGHMVVGEGYYNCNCGKNGCLETFASASALIKYTKKLILEEEQGSSLKELMEAEEELLDAKLIFDKAKDGDAIACKAVSRFVRYLAIGICNLIYTLDPEIIAIGGGVSKAGDFLLELLKAEVDRQKIFKAVNTARLVLAELGNEAGIVGAAMLCRFK
jgi:glucokinase